MYYPANVLSKLLNATLISSIAFLPTHFIIKSSPFFFFSRSSTYKIPFLIRAFLVISLNGSASIGVDLIESEEPHSYDTLSSCSKSAYVANTDLSI